MFYTQIITHIVTHLKNTKPSSMSYIDYFEGRTFVGSVTITIALFRTNLYSYLCTQQTIIINEMERIFVEFYHLRIQNHVNIK